MRAYIIGTRGSSLALCQAEIIRTKLEDRHPDRAFSLKTIRARADRQPDVPLTAMSGEGIFVKELEAALVARQVDLAVHSLKDLPLQRPAPLRLASVLEREEPRDAWVSRSGRPLDESPPGARVGTSSLRRTTQLMVRRKDLELCEIRGNVDTRLRKLADGKYDAIVLAACGLIRLGLEDRITEYLDLSVMLPEPGQGALAIEARADDREVLDLLGPLDDPATRACTEAERAFLAALGGGCRVPIAAYASMKEGALELEGVVVAPDGSASVRATLVGPITEPMSLGNRLAEHVTALGAARLLQQADLRRTP